MFINSTANVDFASNVYDYATNDYVLDTITSNNFEYTEHIYAAYSTLSGNIKNFGYQLGLRAEQANTTSNLITTEEEFINNYFKLGGMTYPRMIDFYRSSGLSQFLMLESLRLNHLF